MTYTRASAIKIKRQKQQKNNDGSGQKHKTRYRGLKAARRESFRHGRKIILEREL